jgi:hypothetical protein
MIRRHETFFLVLLLALSLFVAEQWLVSEMNTQRYLRGHDQSTVTFVVHLGGELGNHLTYLARGMGLVEMAKQEYGLSTKLVLKQQGSSKANRTKQILQRCFPHFRSIDFELGNSEEYDRRKEQQRRNQWTIANQDILDGVNGNRSQVHAAMQHTRFLARSPSKPTIGSDANITLPLVESIVMDEHLFLDEYYDEIRQAFSIDEDVCCRQLPDPDETVFVSTKVGVPLNQEKKIAAHTYFA